MATSGVPLWSTTASSNSSADPAVNWAEGMAPSAVNDSARAMMASVAKWRDDLYGLTTAGSSTAFTVTTNATYASAAAMSGAVFTIIPHTTSGASPTLAVDSLTARALNVSTGVAVPTGALVSGTPYIVKYVHASTEFIVLGSLGKNLLTSLDIINGTSESSVATDDTLPLYDLSNTANRRMLVSDFLKVVNALTEDTTPDRAADYVMSYDGSAAAAKKVKLSNLPASLPRGYIDGCILSNGTDATNDINIAAGVCRDSTNAVDITVSALSGKQLDANWAAGGTAGMRNSAAGITDTTYHIYAVRTAASSTADIYAHTSTTVATVLTALQAETGGADYVYARRIGSIVRASSTIVGFLQVGDRFLKTAPTLDVNDTNVNSSATLTFGVPTGIRVFAKFNWSSDGLNNMAIHFSALDVTDQAASVSAAPLGQLRLGSFPTTIGGGGWAEIMTNTSGQIRADATGNISIDASVTEWTDLRDKDA